MFPAVFKKFMTAGDNAHLRVLLGLEAIAELDVLYQSCRGVWRPSGVLHLVQSMGVAIILCSGAIILYCVEFIL